MTKLKGEYPYKFKVKEKKEDDLETIIEESGMTADLTLRQVQDNLNRVKKMRTEMEAKAKLEEAKMINIVQNAHSDMSSKRLEEMTEKDMQTAYIYANCFVMKKTAEEKLKQIQEALENIAQDCEEITKQTGLKFPEQKDDGKQIN